MGITWEEPEPTKRGPGSAIYAPAAAELKANPGKWAVIATDIAASTAGAMRNGVYIDFRPVGAWEFTARGVANNRAAKIFGRYTGE